MRARLLAVCLLSVAGVAASGVSSAGAVTLPAGFQDTKAPFEGLGHPGMDEPTAIRFAPNGQVFVAQRKGRILAYDSLADASPTLFADLRTQVYDNGDRGILGMALDPNFPAKPYVYVLYTYDHLLGEAAPAPKWGTAGTEGDPCPKPENADVDACPVSGRLVRLTAEGSHAAPEASAPAQKVLVEDWCQQFSSHSIGDLNFGPEGDLFASAGEGASFNSADYGQFGWPQTNQCGDPPGKVGEALKPPTAQGGSLRSQNTESLDGKIIRIDPETGAGLPDNPMGASPNPNRRRIIALGMRNPFRFAINPLTNEVYVDNVGWGTYEEIDRFSTVPDVAYNSGWPCYEGTEPNPAFSGLGLNVCKALYETPGSTSPPFFSYKHGVPVTPEDSCPDQYGSAITGIAFNQGSSLPASYKGALFFADSVRGCIYVMFPGADGRPDPSTTMPFLTEGGYPGVDIEEGPEGSLYYTVLFEGAEYSPSSGSIHKITYSSGNQPPVAKLTVDHEWGPAPLEVHLNASGSTDADGEALSYEWDLTGSGTFGSPGKEATKVKTFSDSKNHVVAVRVKDTQGASSVARVTIYPGDTPPKPTIGAPSPSIEWTVGQPIHFAGTASDEQDGTVPSTSLDWNSRLFHCPSACHAHPLQAFPAVAEGTLIAPDHDLPSHIELTLTATDSRGLQASKSINLNPKAVALEIESEPSGVTVTAGLLTQATPFPVSAIEDSKFTLSAPSTAKVGETTYVFQGWSDAGERVHTVTAGPAPPSYKATYSAPDANLTVAEHWSAGGELQADLDGSPSTDPGQTPKYEWDLNNDGSFEAPSTATKTLPVPGTGSTTVALRVSDARGASDTTRLIFKAISLTLESKPAGVALSAATVTKATPFTILALEGRGLELSAPATVTVDEAITPFAKWSDGGARTHTIVAGPATTKYTATYDPEGPPEEEPGEEEGPGEPGPPPLGGQQSTGAPTGQQLPPVAAFPPRTKLDKHPHRPARSTLARFAFTATGTGTSFRCAIDRKPFEACSSPWLYRHLAPGPHVFRVFAIDPSGLADPSPVAFHWQVRPPSAPPVRAGG
jgi:glucose/arabinose dehydrogenase